MKQLYKQTEQMPFNKITIEDKFKLINIEATLKMLLVHSDLPKYQKKWVAESYKNILDFKHQNDIL